MIYVTGILAACLAAVHVLAARLPALRAVPRSRVLSAAGGVSVAYVFVHILPELSERQEHIQGTEGVGPLRWIEHHVYLLSLLGLAVFYGLERMAITSRRRRRGKGEAAEEAPTRRAFWVHIGSFGVYNGLIGYLLVRREESGWLPVLWFFIAMALHFLVNDYGLRQHYEQLYDRFGRWTLAAAALAGWGVGVGTKLPEGAVAAIFGLVSGAVILNVLKEELPEERESRFWAFGAGAAGYAGLLLLI